VNSGENDRQLGRVFSSNATVTGDDERPLNFDEVLNAFPRQAKIVAREINWPIILTQGIVAARWEVREVRALQSSLLLRFGL
jgi:hypothetical protein